MLLTEEVFGGMMRPRVRRLRRAPIHRCRLMLFVEGLGFDAMVKAAERLYISIPSDIIPALD